MKKLEITDVEATVEKTIDNTGRITGLKAWEGRKAIVVIVEKD